MPFDWIGNSLFNEVPNTKFPITNGNVTFIATISDINASSESGNSPFKDVTSTKFPIINVTFTATILDINASSVFVLAKRLLAQLESVTNWWQRNNATIAMNRSDANKALSKNGMQINGVLIVGVKLVDPAQRQVLNERMNNPGFMSLPPQPWSKSSEPNPLRASSTPYYLQNGNTGARQSSGTIASPAKSVVSKIMDLMFGI